MKYQPQDQLGLWVISMPAARRLALALCSHIALITTQARNANANSPPDKAAARDGSLPGAGSIMPFASKNSNTTSRTAKAGSSAESARVRHCNPV
jgi:hypothetical protein